MLRNHSTRKFLKLAAQTDVCRPSASTGMLHDLAGRAVVVKMTGIKGAQQCGAVPMNTGMVGDEASPAMTKQFPLPIPTVPARDIIIRVDLPAYTQRFQRLGLPRLYERNSERR